MIIGMLQEGLSFAGSRQQLHPADRRRRPRHPDPGADRLDRRRPPGLQGRRHRLRRQGAGRAVHRLSQGPRHVGRRHGADGAAARACRSCPSSRSPAASATSPSRRAARRRAIADAAAATAAARRRSPTIATPTESPDHRQPQDRRAEARARLWPAVAGQGRRDRLRPPHRADQGAAPPARDRARLRHAAGPHPRQHAARAQRLQSQDQGGRRRPRPASSPTS